MRQAFTLFLVLLTVQITFSQNGPIDFEEAGYGADWTWTVFENDTNPPLEIIDNPDASGINASATVAKFTALQTGQPFVGCETLHGAGVGTFTVNDSNAMITIMVWKPVISDVGIKLVREDGWSLGEIKIPNSVVNEWEQLTFDFTDHIGLTYDQLVIFPDFATRTSDNIIYFDNIFGGDGSMPSATNEAEAIVTTLFPNPFEETLTIKAEQSIDVIEILSITGRQKAIHTNVGQQFTLDTGDWANGMYIVRSTIDGRNYVDKVVKGRD